MFYNITVDGATFSNSANGGFTVDDTPFFVIVDSGNPLTVLPTGKWSYIDRLYFQEPLPS
jgi:hypothetical protein